MKFPFFRARDDIRIFVASQNLIFFEFLRLSFGKEHILITGTSSSIEEAMQLCNPLEIDILLLDMAFGAELVRHFQTRRPLLKIIGVKRNFEKPAIEAMRRLKMRGYVYMNPFTIERTIDCILAVARGELYFRFQDEK